MKILKKIQNGLHLYLKAFMDLYKEPKLLLFPLTAGFMIFLITYFRDYLVKNFMIAEYQIFILLCLFITPVVLFVYSGLIKNLSTKSKFKIEFGFTGLKNVGMWFLVLAYIGIVFYNWLLQGDYIFEFGPHIGFIKSFADIETLIFLFLSFFILFSIVIALMKNLNFLEALKKGYLIFQSSFFEFITGYLVYIALDIVIVFITIWVSKMYNADILKLVWITLRVCLSFILITVLPVFVFEVSNSSKVK